MTARRVAIVTTTVNIPVNIDGHLDNAERAGHPLPLVVIVGDRKTPPAIESWVQRAAQRTRVEYLGPDRQLEWLARFPELERLLPWNSIQRRNLGYLRAAELDADVIISIDDDNFAADDDLIGCHRVGEQRDVDLVRSSTGWFNPGGLLASDPQSTLVHRGFPWWKRREPATITRTPAEELVVINAGLWTGEPDVDAVSRVVAPASSTGLLDPAARPVALAPGTFGPFNSQNTAFAVGVLPCMYLVVMGDRYRGMTLGRYDDIWMSYLAKKVLDRVGGVVAYGHPLVHQDRNDHDHLDDLALELPGMRLTRVLLEVLEATSLTATDYQSCYRELAEAILATTAGAWGIHAKEERPIFERMARGMTIWANACGAVRP